MFMSRDVPIAFTYKIAQFYSHGGNVCFLEYSYRHFLDDKIARDTRNGRPTNVSKSHNSFLGIETEIKTSIKSIFYNSAETWGTSWG